MADITNKLFAKARLIGNIMWSSLRYPDYDTKIDRTTGKVIQHKKAYSPLKEIFLYPTKTSVIEDNKVVKRY